MAWKKNADGILQYYYKPQNTVQKIIQKDWFKEHKYKKDKRKGASGKIWDGVSRPSNDSYREQFNRIFNVKEENER